MMKYIVLSLVPVFLCCSCTYYTTAPGYYTTKNFAMKKNIQADLMVDSVNRYLSKYAPGSYAQFLQIHGVQVLGFCFYLSDSTYPDVKKLLGLPEWNSNHLSDGRSLEQVATAGANWFYSHVSQKRRYEYVRVVLGTKKSDPYVTYDFTWQEVTKATIKPFTLGEYDTRTELRASNRYFHRGYELIQECFYCF
jgi:hypothetical protein